MLRTPLFDEHRALGARMVDFHGWEMPLHYGSQLQEHHAVRQDAGMFDVSHMNIVDVLGAGGRQFLRFLLTQDVDILKHVGRALYSCMCNAHGGIIDDLIVYQRAPDNYRLVLNSATRARDLAWLREQIGCFSAGLQERTDLAMLAVQGPNAIAKTLTCLTPAQADAVSTLASFESVEVEHWFFARTGYTGEDGLEIIVPQSLAPDLWRSLRSAGVSPCGLAARDTLRLEAGLLLYGQDMDESTSPLESALAWTVAWSPDDRSFIGSSALRAEKQGGVQRKLVGLKLDGPCIMRSGQRVLVDGYPDGIITSGGYSPTLETSIALARVPVGAGGVGELVHVDIRGKHWPACIQKTRFIQKTLLS